MESDPEIERIKALKMQKLLHGIEDEKRGLKVQVYSTQSCPYCHMAKQYLHSKGVEFEDIDASNNPQVARFMYSHTGQTGVPQINIGGTWVIGFDRNRIDALLALDSD